jgi:ATP-dependent DNA helicase RecG
MPNSTSKPFLDTHLPELLRLNPHQKTALKKIGLATVRDLLYYFPVRYGDSAEARTIGSIREIEDNAQDKNSEKNVPKLQYEEEEKSGPKEEIIVFGKIRNLKTSKAHFKKIAMAEAYIEDDSGSIKAVWFNQPYIAKMIKEDSFVKVQGKTAIRKGEVYLTNPKIENVVDIPLNTEGSLFGEEGESFTLYPVYRETKGISSNWLYHAYQKIISNSRIDEVDDLIPFFILEKYKLPSWKTAMIWIHSPKKSEDAISARKRFSFEEVFLIQLQKQKERLLLENEESFKIPRDREIIQKFLEKFPFKPTEAQDKAIDVILKDFENGRPMSRLLEGDVGSGKTLVAAAATHAVIYTKPKGQNYGSLQVAYMAPTEILAKQHFESFCEFLRDTHIQIALITGSGCFKFPSKLNPKSSTPISRTQLLKWVKNGEIPVVIGTHALIQKSVEFKNLGFIIIDEQHRFGTAQRQKLSNKHAVTAKPDSFTHARIPHLLSMTATPIPRTLALTIYGDLDLTLLDQMPSGRKPIITEIVLPNRREEMYEKMRKELDAGRQAYVICPRINAPDPDKEKSLDAKSVKEEAKRLKEKVLPEFSIDIMHSKMKPADKDKAMKKFTTGETKILVSTSVVEVGVNVPNATVILIEGAERFGLSQLHQLRGRVMRSSHQPYCYILSETKSDKSIERLRALTQAKNGFELSEIDLTLRGAGELYGRKQWGISDIGMEAIKNIKMVEFARAEARELLEKDLELSKFPLLRNAIENKEAIHFE